MTYYTQPIIHAFNEIAPGDTVQIAAKTFDASHTLPAMSWSAERAPLYDSSGLTDPANAVYISPTNATAPQPAGDDTHGTGTKAKPFATVGKARSYIDNTLKTDTWILCLQGNYRDKWNTTFGDNTSHCGGIKPASGAQVWFDGSDFLTGGTWTQSPTNVWTWSGSFSPSVNAADQQVFLDGIPQIKTADATPGLGSFFTSGTTLKIGSTVNPNTKVIEYSNRNAPVTTIKKAGFTIAYIGFRRYSSGTTIFLNGVNQVLDHVVIAYGAGSGYLLNTSGTSNCHLTEVVLTHGAMGKSWNDDHSQNMQVNGMRVWGTNWRHDHNTAPSNSADLGGVKHWKVDGFRGEDMLFGWNVSNGEWFDGSDVGNPSSNNRTTRVTYWFNGGYGQTTEVATTRELADVLSVGNGWMNFGNEDGTRFSGVNASKLYACTSLDNVGAQDANYEDGREYGGPATNFRALNPSVCGDSLNCERMGVVALRTARAGANGVKTGQKPPFWSANQSGANTIAKTNGVTVENGGVGCVQSKPIATADMYDHTKHGKNVYIDVTGSTNVATVSAPDAGATWKISPTPNGSYLSGVTTTEVGGSCSKQATKTLAQMQSLGLDTGSLAIAVANKSIGDYFPSAGSTGGPGENADLGSFYSWFGITDGKIPTDGRSIPTYVPPDWVCDVLGVAHGSTVVAGCKNAPVPQPLGTNKNVAPDIAVLLTPADGDTISGSSVAVTANAHDPNDNHTVTVEIRADGNSIGSGYFLTFTGTGDGFSGTFDSTKLSDGNHDLRVRVTDTQKLWIASTKHTVTVSNGADTTPPTVGSLSGITDGDTVRDPVTISVPVTDVSGVASVIARVIAPDGTQTDYPMS